MADHEQMQSHTHPLAENRVRAESHAEPPRARAKVKRNGSDDDRSGDGKSGDNKSGDSNSGDDKSGDGKSAGQDKKDDGKKDEGNKKKSKLPIIIGVIVLLLAIAGGAVYWFLTRNLVSTDDAYTEGRAITVAPQVAGYVTELAVTDNQFVHAGDVIIRIDQRDYIAQRDQATANLELAQAQLHSAQIDLDIARVRYPAELKQAEAQRAAARANQAQAQSDYRRQRAVDPRATTQTNIDTANAALQSNTAQVAQSEAQVQVAGLTQQNIQLAEAVVRQRQAQVDQAKASLAQAEVNLSYTVIRAAQDGRVTRRNVEKGAYLQQGQSVMSLVTPEVWVTANFKETQLTGMKVGQKVEVEVDAYPDLKLHGHVDSFQMGSGARFSAFPAENATGNFVKIVRRVPVKIVIDNGLPDNMPLPLGISVVPTVTVE